MPMPPKDKNVIRLWKDRICTNSRAIDPCNERDWYAIWIGFVIGLGRDDLSNYETYMKIGFPEERVMHERNE